MKACVTGASRKLGQYMVRHALDRGCEAEWDASRHS